MSEQESAGAAYGGEEVFVITYDEEGNEVRVSPADAGDAAEKSYDLGLGRGTRKIRRLKHRPFVASEAEIRAANIGSLAAALKDNYLGTALYVDRNDPPVDEDMYEPDDRYHLDVRDGRLVAVVTQRYATQPPPNEERNRGDAHARRSGLWMLHRRCDVHPSWWGNPGGVQRSLARRH